MGTVNAISISPNDINAIYVATEVIQNRYPTPSLT